MATNFNNYNIPTDGYVAFDATSLKNLIVSRLNTNNVFTDQNFEGSNISSLIDIIAYSYNVLMFYLNRTSSESTFTTAELFENINKIVKLINYNPIGNQTSVLSFLAKATSSLPQGIYTIPRYSFFTVTPFFVNTGRQPFSSPAIQAVRPPYRHTYIAQNFFGSHFFIWRVSCRVLSLSARCYSLITASCQIHPRRPYH